MDFPGEQRPNETHEWAANPQTQPGRKSATAQAKLCYLGRVLTDNRHVLVGKVRVAQAYRRSQREAALAGVRKVGGSRRVTLAGGPIPGNHDFVGQLRQIPVTPHGAQRRSAVDPRTGRHEGLHPLWDLQMTFKGKPCPLRSTSVASPRDPPD